ncbi:MAG: dihydrolipoamide acetyltransferase family protein, partial [Acidimicrobiales bacterium]
EAGIDLRTITGTGPAGRITHDDLDAAFSATNGSGRAGTASAQIEWDLPNDTVTDQPIVGVRRKIAEQMVASTTTIPHITYVEEIDMTALEDLRRALNEQSDQSAVPRPKLTILPFLIRALVRELPNFPTMNAHVLDPAGDGPATLRTFGGVHVGIATQTDNGLVVPVVHHAEASSLWAMAEQIAELADAARSGTADRTDLTGSTITITSLGPLGGLMSTPVINRPETTIIGVNKMMTKPVWIDGSFVPRTMMNLSSSFDHRVIDGWVAANFVQSLKRSLEQPALLFVESP